MSVNWKKKIFDPRKGLKPAASGTGPADQLLVPPLLLSFFPSKANPVLAVFDTLAAAETAKSFFERWAAAVRSPVRTLLLPDGVRHERMASLSDSARSRALHALLTDPPDILFASAAGILNPVPSVAEMEKHSFSIRRGQTYSLTELARTLAELDYDDESQVTSPGEFSRRGGLIDVFSPSGEFPARIEFFGDTVESIRLFSPATQRSLREESEYEIIPRSGSANAMMKSGEFKDYLAHWKPLFVPVYPRELRIQVERFAPELLEHWDAFPELFEGRTSPIYDETSAALEKGVVKPPFFALHGMLRKALPEGGEKAFSDLARHWMQSTVRRWLLEEGYTVVFLPRSEADETHFRAWIEEAGIAGHKHVFMERLSLPGGLFMPSEKIVLLTELEVFSAPVSTRIANSGEKEDGEAEHESAGTVDSSADLEEGDYAVHLNYGICIFRGLRIIEAGGVREEMISLEFADETIMHVPLRQAHLLSRYIGSGGSGVKLNAVRSSKWGKTKAEALLSVRNLAYDMLRMQAVRAAAHGSACPPDGLEQRLFEQAFPFQETADQLRSAGEIKRDMESEKPMDRLLCGDVGYGKTELAMRAAFKCVMSGRQVAVLVPTTVLAQQHYYSFLERFAGTPVMIEQLSRFRTKAEQAEILRRMRDGSLDIVIGTHRLVQDDVAFKNLGLIVIDEEQRFGVAHKEKLKRLRASVDVLTMTATPIPRTLYMSMSGLRDMSTILSAPVRRLPIQTVIVPDDPTVVRMAIARELERGGQVYYVHNRVQGIEDFAAKVNVMFPRARIGVGHGRMPEEELEQVMSRFIEGKIDILVCTTIIESGLDIPNANTILIDRADRFGLAELYQLRGRVGRWTRQAYAYLLLPRSGILTGDARKRIAAMRRYTHLGSGFNLAMSDLQIRGAGNILGAEQSGQINAVGFHLYCSLLRDFTAQIGKKELAPPLPDPEIRLDFLSYSLSQTKGKLQAVFPPEYISEPLLRFHAYRRYAVLASIPELDAFADELKDRFGRLPACAENLLAVARLRIIAKSKHISSIAAYDEKIILERGHAVLKPGGFVPRIPSVMTPDEKMRRVFWVLDQV